jgi:hypothetical protein
MRSVSLNLHDEQNLMVFDIRSVDHRANAREESPHGALGAGPDFLHLRSLSAMGLVQIFGSGFFCGDKVSDWTEGPCFGFEKSRYQRKPVK